MRSSLSYPFSKEDVQCTPCSGSGLFFSFFPVGEKIFHTDIGQRVFDQLTDDLEGNGSNIRASQCGIDHMDRVADAGDNNFCLVAEIVEDGDDVADQFHARM